VPRYYSVPFGLLRETVEARFTDGTIEVFHKGERIASHMRSRVKAAGAEKVYSEKQSGAKTDRAALSKALAALGAGDVLLVNSAWIGSQGRPGTL
jgi:DNA invertase Pin-like site-specific DNA recombinase